MKNTKGNVANKKAEATERLVAYLTKAVEEHSKELGKELTDKANKVLSLAEKGKASGDTLNAVINEVTTTILASGEATPKVEAQAKVKVKSTKTTGKKASKEEPKEVKAEAEVKEEAPQTQKEEAPKTEGKAKKLQKGTPKAEGVKAEAKEVAPKKTAPKKGVETRSLVVSFPSELVIEELGTLVLNTEIATVQDVQSAVDNGDTLIFAVYWDERLLRQYEYDTLKIGTPVKKFDNDLDLCQILYVNENGKAVVTNSLYTEVLSVFLAKDLAVDEVTGLRYANGAEFAIYNVK